MLSPEKLQALRAALVSYRNSAQLPGEDCLSRLLDVTIGTLEGEPPEYRPPADDGKPGALLDFSGNDLPAIIVPDLHARPDFLIRLMDCPFGAGTVLSALNQGAVNVICVGDGVHTENMTWAYARWKESLLSWERGSVDCAGMRAEMHDGFATMMGVASLKNAFPRCFHFLKGNHENILNREGGGDHPFRKFAFEGEMVRSFIHAVYGDVLLHLIHCFECVLPLVVIGGRFGVSHAEPFTAYSRDEIINGRADAQLVHDFTWTANDEALEGSVRSQFAQLNAAGDAARMRWFGGHRPIEGKYFLRQDGAFVQIHNPNEMNVAFVPPDREFCLERDIVAVSGGSFPVS